MKTPALTERSLSSIADELAIRNLYSAYMFAVDTHDEDAFADCFTADAEIEVTSFKVMRGLIASGRAPFVNGEGRVVGTANIRAMSGVIPKNVTVQHVNANIWITRLEGDRARGQAAFTVFADDGLVEHYGHYIDRIERCPDGRWRFSERRDVCRYERAREASPW